MQSAQHIVSAINAAYSSKANEASDPTRLEYFRKAAASFGYTEEQLSLVEGANMGLGCGNPVAMANIKPGETVADLGCGGGVDVILASAQVGPTGTVWGVDMNKDMIALAQKNTDARHLSNVKLVTSSITDLSAIPSRSIDCVISNRVINLIPHGGLPHVFTEAFRILKPGGRLAICDIVMKEEIPDDLEQQMFSFVGGIAGAIDTDVYRRMLMDAGFENIVMVETVMDLGVCLGDVGLPGNLSSGTPSALRNAPNKYNINDYASSCQIFAIKHAM